jgi:predicted dehydrogenase
MQKTINVAVVGCGYWGPNLIRNFRALQDCHVKKVCDIDEGRLLHMKNIYPEVETTTDFNDLIMDDEIDAIVIATPVNTHFPLTRESLMAGKHTFVEKPMAMSVEECEKMNELASERNLTLMVGHTFIYSAPVRKIKEIITSGDIGEIYYISSRRLNLGLFQKDINVAWDLAPHCISIILYFLGLPPSAVNCQGKHHITEGIEDVTNITIDFANGALATIQSSWLDPNKVRDMIIVGSKRMIVYNDTEPLEKIKIYDKRVERPPHYDTFADFHYSYHYGDMYVPYIKQVEPLKVETQHFIDCLRNGAKPMTSGSEGLQVIQVLEAANESLKNQGKRVDLAFSSYAALWK